MESENSTRVYVLCACTFCMRINLNNAHLYLMFTVHHLKMTCFQSLKALILFSRFTNKNVFVPLTIVITSKAIKFFCNFFYPRHVICRLYPARWSFNLRSDEYIYHSQWLFLTSNLTNMLASFTISHFECTEINRNFYYLQFERVVDASKYETVENVQTNAPSRRNIQRSKFNSIRIDWR